MPTLGRVFVCCAAVFLTGCEKVTSPAGPLGSIAERHLEGAQDGSCSRTSSKCTVDSIAFYDCNWRNADTLIMINTSGTGTVRRLTMTWRVTPSHAEIALYSAEVLLAKELGESGRRCLQPEGQTLAEWRMPEFEVQLFGSPDGLITITYHLGHPALIANCED
jgi:hypothetical protein